MSKRLILITISVWYGATCTSIHAQGVDSTRTIKEDGWVEVMTNKLSTDVSFNNAFETFEVKTTGDKFILYPNTPTGMRLKLAYRFITFAFQFAPDFIPGNGDENLKGKTKSFGIGTSLIFKHWLFDIHYSKVRGYYLENSADYFAGINGDPYIQFPDLQYQGISFSTGYSTNSKFSMRSLTAQTERQLKSAGSFIPVLDFRYFVMDDRSNNTSTQKTNNIETSIGPGYGYTFVIKEKIYFSLNMAAGIGYLNTRLTTRQPSENIISNQNNLIYKWDGKAGVGFNGNWIYSGLYANVSGTHYQQEHTTASNFETRILYHLFLGFRFNAPKVLKAQVDFIEKKIP